MNVRRRILSTSVAYSQDVMRKKNSQTDRKTMTDHDTRLNYRELEFKVNH